MSPDAKQLTRVLRLSAIAILAACGTDSPRAPVEAPATRPWLGAPLAASGGTCGVPGPGFFCGMTIGISPYSTGGVFGGFQSGPGTGASSTITVTFSLPVSSVTVTALDPDFAGNRMVAFDRRGAVVDSKTFAVDNQPGVFTSSTVTVQGFGIASVQLIPGPQDYVAYDGLVIGIQGINCPTGDAVLDDIQVRLALREALQDSRPDTQPDTLRKEWSGYIFRMQDGSLKVVTLADPLQTNCQTALLPGGGLNPNTPAGATLAGLFHTHPYAPWDKISQCTAVPAGPAHVPGFYNPDPLRSGQAHDWEVIRNFNTDWTAAGNAPVSDYVIDKRYVYRLDPTIPVGHESGANVRFSQNTNSCQW